MFSLLERLPSRELSSAIGAETIRRLGGLVSPEADDPETLPPSVLAQYLLALHGTEVLGSERIRQLVFGLVEPNRLQEMAERHAGRSYPKPYDNALLLSALPWRAGSRLVDDVSVALEIPREYLPSVPAPTPTSQTLEPLSPLPLLHSYQSEVMAEIVERLQEGRGAFLVQMPTGAGKTRTAVEGIVRHIESTGLFRRGHAVLWLAHSEELCEQAIETVTRVWTSTASSPADLLRCFGNHNPDATEIRGSFIVGTFQKLSSLATLADSDLFSALRTSCAIVVVDEAHRVLAPTFAAATEAIVTSGTTLVGLTATPGRGREAERENKELARLFDNNLVTAKLGADPIHKLRKMGILSRTRHRTIDSGVSVHLSRDNQQSVDREFDLPGSVLQRLGNHRERNRHVLAAVVDELSQGRPTLVFCCSVEHSKVLAAALTLLGHPAGQIDGAMRRSFRRTVIDDFRNEKIHALTNFGVLSTGFDAPRIRSVVITRPTASIVLYSQMVGRGLRGPKMGGGEECELIDIRDNFVNFGSIDAVYSFFDDYWTGE